MKIPNVSQYGTWSSVEPERGERRQDASSPAAAPTIHARSVVPMSPRRRAPVSRWTRREERDEPFAIESRDTAPGRSPSRGSTTTFTTWWPRLSDLRHEPWPRSLRPAPRWRSPTISACGSGRATYKRGNRAASLAERILPRADVARQDARSCRVCCHHRRHEQRAEAVDARRASERSATGTPARRGTGSRLTRKFVTRPRYSDSRTAMNSSSRTSATVSRTARSGGPSTTVAAEDGAEACTAAQALPRPPGAQPPCFSSWTSSISASWISSAAACAGAKLLRRRRRGGGKHAHLLLERHAAARRRWRNRAPSRAA